MSAGVVKVADQGSGTEPDGGPSATGPGVEQLELFSAPPGPGSGAPVERRPAQAAAARPVATSRRDAGAAMGSDDADWRRLENSVRWLQAESSASRLPPASQLTSSRGPHRVTPAIRPRPEPRPESRLRAAAPPLALAPDILRRPAVPPRSLAPDIPRRPPVPPRGGTLRAVTMVLLASGVAAVVAYYFAISTGPRPTPVAGSDAQLRPSLPPEDGAHLPVPPGDRSSTAWWQPPEAVDPDRPRSVDAAEPHASASTPFEPKTAVIEPAGPSSRVAPRVAPGTAEPVAAVAPTAVTANVVDPVTSGLARDVPAGPDSAVLVERGRQFLEAGDVTAARLLFRRAAEAGDAAGALGMGSTYDPVVFAQRHVRGVRPDIAAARTWYEKAKALGAADGQRRLDLLADR